MHCDSIDYDIFGVNGEHIVRIAVTISFDQAHQIDFPNPQVDTACKLIGVVDLQHRGSADKY